MKVVLSGLFLLCVHTGAAALDGRTSPQWSDQFDTIPFLGQLRDRMVARRGHA